MHTRAMYTPARPPLPARPAAPLAWRRPALVLLAALCAVGLHSTALAARLALVVGNDNYRQVALLKNAVRDAELMAQTLQAAGFTVTLQRNLDRQALYAAIDRLQGQVNSGDEVAFFFAGHGVQVGNDQVLLPVDIQADDERKVLREGVPLLYVQDALKAARLAMLVVDACRDNPFPKTGTRSIGDARGLRPPEPAKGQVVILSAGRGEKALDAVPGEPNARNGLFTWEFARVLRTPGLDVLSALRRVRDQVEDRAAAVSHRQRPSLVDDLRGQFYLFGAPAAPNAPLQQVAVVAPERAIPTLQSGLVAGQVLKDCDECPELVVVPGGSFVMGSPENEPQRRLDEGPQRRVTIQAVAVGRYEVTFGQWDACVAAQGCSHRPADNGWGRGDRPVMNVSWEDAQQYVKWLSQKTGKEYRLLSEAEWEYAARGGTETPFQTGQTIATSQANFDGTSTYNGSAKGEFRGMTVPVGQFAPNTFGLYDMHGSVWEWVQDVWHGSYLGAPTDGSAWMAGGDRSRRVLRGGSWGNYPRFLRSAMRYHYAPDDRDYVTGFRIARAL